LGFGGGTAPEAPRCALDLHSQHFFDRASRAEFFPEGLREFGMFVSFFGLHTILHGEEAEFEVIARRSGFTLQGRGSGGISGIEAIGLNLSGGWQG
jgi:hypothetical protein